MLQNLIMSVSAFFALLAFILNYTKKRNEQICYYYRTTQDLRSEIIESNSIKNVHDKEKTKSQLLKKFLNLYETISYSVLKKTVSEYDAYNLLLSNLNFLYKNCINSNVDLSKHKYFTKLVKRWKNYDLKLYHINRILLYSFVIIVLILMIYVNLLN